MNIKKNLSNFFFPKYCLSCQRLKTWLCSDCFLKIKKPKTTCFLCNKENKDGKICPLCLYYQGDKSHFLSFNHLIYYSSYKEKTNKKLISALKYGGVKEIADILSFMINEKINENWKNFEAELFYVPSNKLQEKIRDYNQTKLIAQNLATLNKNLKLNHGLITKKFKQRQTSKNVKKRWENLNEFLYHGYSLRDKHLLIIDDLVTSGATLNQIAKCLKKHKPKSIRGAVAFKA